MEATPLEDYIRRKRELARQEKAPAEENPHPAPNPVVKPSDDPVISLPENYIPSIKLLEHRFQSDPRYTLNSTLDKILTELLNLEHYCKVAIINRAVVEASHSANLCRKQAKIDWLRNFNNKAAKEARNAVSHSLRGLICAYQHTAAHKIVVARRFIEGAEWLEQPVKLLSLHKKARILFERGRSLQVRPDHDKARELFRESILTIRYLDLKVEDMVHLMK